MAGAYIGAMVDCSDLCGGFFVGAVAGQAVGIPLGAHAGNGGRGNLGSDLLVSLGIAGIGAVGTLQVRDGRFYLMTLATQLVAVVATEIRTSPDVVVTAGPRLVGEKVGVGVSIAW